MLIPAILDFFLWLGPRLSMQPVIAKMVTTLEEWSVTLGQNAGPEAVEALRANIELLQTSGAAEVNLFQMLAWGSSLGLPTLAGAGLTPPASPKVLQVYELWQLVPLELALLAGGLLIVGAFLSLLGWSVRGEPLAWGRLAKWTLTTSLRLLVIMIPLGAIMVGTLIATVLLGFLGVIVLMGVVWLLLYISLTPQAVALAGHGPLQAVLSSAQIVRLNLWPTVKLLGLVFLLSTGLGLVWQQLVAHSTWGTVAAIAGNTFVGTALAAALFVFYRDRVSLLQEMIARQRSVERS